MKTIQTNSFKKLAANRGGYTGAVPSAIPLAPENPNVQTNNPYIKPYPTQQLIDPTKTRFNGIMAGIQKAFSLSGLNTNMFIGPLTDLINAIMTTHPLVQQPEFSSQPSPQTQPQASSNRNRISTAQLQPTKNANYFQPIWDIFAKELQSVNININSIKSPLSNLIIQMCNSLTPSQLDLVLQNGLGLKWDSRGRGRQTIMTQEPQDFWGERAVNLVNGLAGGGPSWW